MRNITKYNIFLLISTLARNVASVFSLVLLSKMGYSLKEIMIFLSILYFFGAITNIITIFLINKVKIKYLLIVSSLIFSISFYYMSSMKKNFIHLIIFSILYSIGSYSYHSIRHFLAMNTISKNRKNSIGNIIIYLNIAIIISSFISGYIESITSITVLAIIVIFISLIGIIPVLELDMKSNTYNSEYLKIDKNRILFFVLEQGKVLYLTLEPLFIYLFIDNSVKFVGLTSSIVGISTCIFVYFFVRRVNDKKYFKYCNVIFCLILFFKLNITSKYLMLLVVFLEGFFIKIYEIVSMNNLYDVHKTTDIKKYLMVSLTIFCLIRSFLCFVFIFINNLKIILYFLIIFVFVSGFIKRK